LLGRTLSSLPADLNLPQTLRFHCLNGSWTTCEAATRRGWRPHRSCC